MEFTLTSPRKGRILVVGKIEGVTKYRETFTPDKTSEQHRFVKETGLSVDILHQAADEAVGNRAVEIRAVVESSKKYDLRFYRRRRYASESIEFRSIEDALASSTYDDVIEWDDIEKVAVLDVDYHSVTADLPDDRFLRHTLSRVMPVPSLWWVTKGFGLHAVFKSSTDFTASELASIAGIAWKGLDSRATFEVINKTSGCDKIRVLDQVSDPTSILKWVRRNVDQEQIEAYLDANGYEIGRSYPHEKCPFLPHESSHALPVHVMDGGIYCHKCNALGFRSGSRRDGFFPYSTLIHGGTPNHIRVMADNFTHWEQAKLVIEDTLHVRGNNAELGYRSLLKVLHRDDPRIDLAFRSGNNIIRLIDRWGTRDTLSNYDKNIQPILATLPVCQTAKGKVIPERVARFNQNHDLAEYGYHAIIPIHGLRIYSHRLGFANTDRITTVVPSMELRSPTMERFRPKYLAPSKRLPDARQVIEQVMPGINWNYVELLIGAKGVAEGGVGLPPNIFVVGPSESGKTSLAMLAAAICGDHNTEVPWQKSVERFRQGVQVGSEAGTFITVNEILKNATSIGSTAIKALDVFLTLTPESVSHKLYTGPVALGKLPVCICTDTQIPQVLRNDTQLARRFIYVRLRDTHPEWQYTLPQHGVHKISELRNASEQLSFAADSVVSEVIDKFFDKPRTLAEIAYDLGYTTLVDSPDFDDPNEFLRKLFDAVCNAPETTQKRWVGSGWKVISPGDETELCEAWEAVHNGASGDAWFESRTCEGTDWRRLLRTKEEVRLELRRFRNLLAVRFRTVGNTTILINQEIVA